MHSADLGDLRAHRTHALSMVGDAAPRRPDSAARCPYLHVVRRDLQLVTIGIAEID
jgi:hypothetical protein